MHRNLKSKIIILINLKTLQLEGPKSITNDVGG